jgi:hypothetical protein
VARIVMTFTANDREVAARLEAWLTGVERHEVIALEGLRLSGEGLKDRAVLEITRADYVLAILSKNSWASPGFAFELGLVRSFEVTLQRSVLVGAVIDDAPVPSVLGSRPTIRLATLALEESFPALGNLLREPIVEQPPMQLLAFGQAQALIATGQPAPAWTEGIADLAASLNSNRLVLFLGAGVSVSAGAPTWQKLVDRVMESAFGRMTAGAGVTSERVARLMRLHGKASDLILAQHARRELGTKFYDVVQIELYRGAAGVSRLVTALGELVQRQRSRAAVTYNFDDFFERELKHRSVRHQAVTRAGERSYAGFPVFHVHGLIPPRGHVRRAGLVFAESEFNDESLDPYRWSALVQISHLSHSTCLFVGASIQDPNLRRLLEVVKKRSSEDVSPHFVIYKRTDPTDLIGYALTPPLSVGEAARAAEVVDRLVEGDLNDLGLQVLWVRDHGEVADVVMELATTPIVATAP